MKKLYKLFFASLALVLAGAVMISASTAYAAAPEYVTVTGYDADADYYEMMRACAEDGSEGALLAGWVYEQQRNLKIDDMKLSYEKTEFFELFDAGPEIVSAMEQMERWWTEEELDLLSRLVFAELGADWVPDWAQQAVASVVINRVKSPTWPNTIRDVIYQPGQYGPAWNGAIYNASTDKVRRNVRYVLDNGPTCPGNVVFQATAVQGGGIYKSYYDSVMGNTTYFCYG